MDFFFFLWWFIVWIWCRFLFVCLFFPWVWGYVKVLCAGILFPSAPLPFLLDSSVVYVFIVGFTDVFKFPPSCPLQNSHIVVFHELPQLFCLVVFFLVALTPVAGTSPTWRFPHFDLMHPNWSQYRWCHWLPSTYVDMKLSIVKPLGVL